MLDVSFLLFHSFFRLFINAMKREERWNEGKKRLSKKGGKRIIIYLKNDINDNYNRMKKKHREILMQRFKTL